MRIAAETPLNMPPGLGIIHHHGSLPIG